MSIESSANRSYRFIARTRSCAEVARGTEASSAVAFSGLFLVAALLAGCGGRAEHGGGNAYDAGGAGAASNAGGASAAAAGASAAAGTSDDGGSASETCAPGGAPLRRLTNAEYTKTIVALFGDTSPTTSKLAQEWHPVPTGNLAERQLVGSEQATAYFQMAKELAERATRDSNALAALAACAAAPKPDAPCARTVIETFAAKAFRRAPTEQELNELLALHTSITDNGGDFAAAIRAVIAAILQAPDFLYRIEWGTDEGPRPDVQRLTGDEMATRLSYLFWGTSPDEPLRVAAQSGALLDPDGIAKQAARLLDDPRSHAGLAAFFDDFLELNKLSQLQRSDLSYSPELGVSLQEATQRFLESQIFDHDASWRSVLTSSTAIVNGSVASLYGVAGVTGDTWQEVSLDATQRLGLLTHPSSLMVGVATDETNPTQRGYRIMEKILCREVPPEPADVPVTGTITDGVTTRQRWTQFTSPSNCTPCHHDMDQLGYALEAFDVMGRYRTTENGVDIDTKVDVTGLGPTDGPVELVKKLAALPETQACFAQRFAEFSLGKALADDPAGPCLRQDIARRFEAGGYNVRQLLLDLTHTDAFLYLPKER